MMFWTACDHHATVFHRGHPQSSGQWWWPGLWSFISSSRVVVDNLGQGSLSSWQCRKHFWQLLVSCHTFCSWALSQTWRDSRRWRSNDTCAACFSWALTFSMVVKTPVDSTAYLVPASPHLMLIISVLEEGDSLPLVIVSLSQPWQGRGSWSGGQWRGRGGVVDGSSIHVARIEEQVPSSAQSVHLDLNLCVSGTRLTLELGGTEFPHPQYWFWGSSWGSWVCTTSTLLAWVSFYITIFNANCELSLKCSDIEDKWSNRELFWFKLIDA